MIENENLNIYIIVVVASLIGAVVRIFLEWDKQTLTRSRLFLIIAAGIAVSIIFYLVNDWQSWMPEKYIAVPSIVSGIVAMEVVKFFIEYVPTILKKKADNL